MKIGVELESERIFELEIESVVVVELLLTFVANEFLGNHHLVFEPIYMLFVSQVIIFTLIGLFPFSGSFNTLIGIVYEFPLQLTDRYGLFGCSLFILQRLKLMTVLR